MEWEQIQPQSIWPPLALVELHAARRCSWDILAHSRVSARFNSSMLAVFVRVRNFFLVVGEFVRLYLLVGLDKENSFENALDATLQNMELFRHLTAALGRTSLQSLFNLRHHRRWCCSLTRATMMSHFNAAGIFIPFYGAIHKHFRSHWDAGAVERRLATTFPRQIVLNARCYVWAPWWLVLVCVGLCWNAIASLLGTYWRFV